MDSRPLFEVSIATRGNCAAALAALIPHAAQAPFPVRVVTPGEVTEPRLLETLSRLGCRVEVTYTPRLSLASARATQLEAARAHIMVSIDDDAVLAGDFWKLAHVLDSRHEDWAAPVVRFVQNFREPPPDHTEIWEPTSGRDPRVRRARHRHGPGWVRTFDVGADVQSDQLPGTCFAVKMAAARHLAPELAEWRESRSVDAWMGGKLGLGVIVHDVYAYHWGYWSPAKWDMGATDTTVAKELPDVYSRLQSRRL